MRQSSTNRARDIFAHLVLSFFCLYLSFCHKDRSTVSTALLHFHLLPEPRPGTFRQNLEQSTAPAPKHLSLVVGCAENLASTSTVSCYHPPFAVHRFLLVSWPIFRSRVLLGAGVISASSGLETPTRDADGRRAECDIRIRRRIFPRCYISREN